MKPTFLSDNATVGKDMVTNSTAPVTSNELANARPRQRTMKDTIEFNVKAFYETVEKNGLITSWEQSFMCPCVNPMTMAPDPNCKICHGTGRGYLPAVNGVSVVIQENGKGRRVTATGQYDRGTAQGTVQMGYRVSAWDRITVPDFTARQQYLFNVTQDRIDNGQYIPYDVKNIIYIAYGSDDTELKQAVEGVDFTFDRKLDKLYPSQALLNSKVTMILNVTIRYIVLDVDKELRYQYTERNQATKKFDELPRLVTLKREEAFINNIPLINPTTSELTTKASQTTINEVSVANTDNGFGM